LKEAISSEPILNHFEEGLETIVQTDASGTGLGAVLAQIHNGQERVVAFASRRLSESERKCHSSETECLAVVWAIQKFHPYLFGRHFTVVTDSIALKYLLAEQNGSLSEADTMGPQVARIRFRDRASQGQSQW
jgi:hypothetical protein